MSLLSIRVLHPGGHPQQSAVHVIVEHTVASSGRSSAVIVECTVASSGRSSAVVSCQCHPGGHPLSLVLLATIRCYSYYLPSLLCSRPDSTGALRRNLARCRDGIPQEVVRRPRPLPYQTTPVRSSALSRLASQPSDHCLGERFPNG